MKANNAIFTCLNEEWCGLHGAEVAMGVTVTTEKDCLRVEADLERTLCDDCGGPMPMVTLILNGCRNSFEGPMFDETEDYVYVDGRAVAVYRVPASSLAEDAKAEFERQAQALEDGGYLTPQLDIVAVYLVPKEELLTEGNGKGGS